MNLKTFVLKLIGYKKPSILQMLIRRLEIYYDKTHGLDQIDARKVTVALVELFDVVSSF